MRWWLAGLVFACASTAGAGAPGVADLWIGHMTVEASGFVSPELAWSLAIDRAEWLDLAPDGTATGCFATRRSSGGFVGDYAPKGVPRGPHDSVTTEILGVRGDWKIVGSIVVVAMTAETHGACLGTFYPLERPMRMLCRVSPGGPMTALICGGDGHTTGIALDQTAQGWNPARTPEGTSLIFGRAPGISVSIVDHTPYKAPEVRVTAGAPPLHEADYARH